MGLTINDLTTDLTFSDTPAPLVTYFHNNVLHPTPYKRDVTNMYPIYLA